MLTKVRTLLCARRHGPSKVLRIMENSFGRPKLFMALTSLILVVFEKTYKAL